MPKCIRCHGPVPDGRSVCGKCNPAGLPTPAPTQFHGTAFAILGLLAVAAAVIGMFVFRSDGDAFGSRVVTKVRESPTRVTAVIEVQNRTDETLSGACTVSALSDDGRVLTTARVEIDRLAAAASKQLAADLETAVDPGTIGVRCR
jgi:hypothetical protein